MQLEFSYPYGTLKEFEIEQLKNQLISLHNYDKEISKAEVILKETLHGNIKSFECEIIISIYGDSFFYNRDGNSYTEAIREAVRVTEEKVKELITHKNDLPEEFVSTIKV